MNSSGAMAKRMLTGAAALVVCVPEISVAQDASDEVPRDESAFVVQAPEDQGPEDQAPDASSKVYFPDTITPQSVAAARARAARQQQIEAAAETRDTPVAQVTTRGDGRGDGRSDDVAQLSDGSSTKTLAQLSAAERRVLLDAVEGSDICERGSDIPALKALCETRIETRSQEFAQTGSAEDKLLGGGLDASRIATLQSAISRLAGGDADPSNFSNQAVASVALNNQTLRDVPATAAEGDPTADLSQETQAVVAAIVQQLGGGN